MPDLAWLPEASLVAVAATLGCGSIWLLVTRVPRRVWSDYSRQERRRLRKAVARGDSRTIEDVARPEHRAAFHRSRRATATVLRMALGCIAVSMIAFVLSVLSRPSPYQ